MTTIPLPTDEMTAEDFFRALRTLRERLPEPQALEPGQANSRLGHMDVNFVHASVNAVSASEGVQKVLARTPENLRGEIGDSVSWNAVADELRAMLKAVTSANTVRKRRIGLTAMQTFKICQQLARDPAHAALVSHIEEMKRLNRFGRRRARRTEPAPEPAPQPAPV
jgi:hypothetical protein